MVETELNLSRPWNGERCYVIAEGGVNHNGSLELAKELVVAAREAGADAVKFQTFHPEDFVSETADKAKYQASAVGKDGSQLSLLRSLMLRLDDFLALAAHAESMGITLVSTPFETKSALFLDECLDVPYFKIGSGDLTNPFLLHLLAGMGKPVILSSGLADLEEIRAALWILDAGRKGRTLRSALDTIPETGSPAPNELSLWVALLHCVTAYPTPIADANLRAIDTLREAFGVPIGYSDHTLGITAAVAAAARGARIIEKHLTLDCAMVGPDHGASIEPADFARMVAMIRETESALGDGIKLPRASELVNLKAARKSVVANRAIAKGEKLCESDLSVKRPGGGIAPGNLFKLIGGIAVCDIARDELVPLVQLTGQVGEC